MISQPDALNRVFAVCADPTRRAERDGKTTLTITYATAADREAMRHPGVDTGTARTLNHPGAYLAGIG